MTDREQRADLGRVARVSGEVRAASARWEVEMQRALLEDGEPQLGDDALLERLCENASLTLGSIPARENESADHVRPNTESWARRRSPRTMTYVVAAAVLLLSFAAFGLQAMVSSRPSVPPSRGVAPTWRDSNEHAMPGGARLPAVPKAAPPPEPSLPPEPSARPLPAGAADNALPVTDSAQQLFAAAKVAQRSGDIRLAITLFDRLQQRFPLSAEAQVSHVVLGSLLMSRGEAARALTHYQSYLVRGGPLAEDALLGRARALGIVGRSAEEARAWQALLERYPNSVHSQRARERLRRLGE